MTLAAALVECVRAWPGGSVGAGFALLLVVQSVALSALWSGPLAALFAAASGIWARVSGESAPAAGPARDRLTAPGRAPPAAPDAPTARDRLTAPADSPAAPDAPTARNRLTAPADSAAAPDAPTAPGLDSPPSATPVRGASRRPRVAAGALLWIGPVVLLQITAGTALLRWSARAFVRQDLAQALMPAALLATFAAAGLLGWIGHRFTRRWTARLPRWAVLGLAALAALAAVVVHLVRFPALLLDGAVPALLQLVVIGAGGAAVFAGVSRAPVRPGAPALVGSAAVVLILIAGMAFGGRIAPLSYPVASAAIQTRGLMAARIASALARAGDRDGDHVSAWFGGDDCDDSDPAVSPLATDVPGNGIDEDCFEGDLAARPRRAAAAARPAGRPRARNLVLITVDALRADAVGWSGRKASPTPELDRLAARSTVLTSAWTQAPMTRKAFPSLLTGRYPSNVHWLDLRDGSMYPVSHQDNLFVAEIARAGGIDTGMVVGFAYPQLGRFDQGFRLQKVHPASRFKKEINANVVVDDAIRALEGWAGPDAGGERPRFFFWLHFYEAHYPYVAHKGMTKFGRGDQGRYLSEVRYIDDQLGRFLRRLDELGLAGDTAVVFTSDHGEEFGEHGGKWHGDLYPEDLHVPLFVHVPGGAPRRIAAPARLVDIAPTVLEVLGLPVPGDLDGESLLPWIEGRAPEPRLVIAELIPDAKVPRRVLAAVSRGWLFVVDFALGTRELYDLARDPAAQDNVLVESPDRARELEVELRRHLALRVGPLRITPAPRPARRK